MAYPYVCKKPQAQSKFELTASPDAFFTDVKALLTVTGLE